jgi:Ca2+-binding RTX toxin-like protein
MAFRLLPPPPPATNTPGLIFISGIAALGQTLTAKVSDADGVAAGGITYAWQANGVDLGISASSFVVTADLVEQAITATAAYIDDEFHAEFLTSDPKTIAAPADDDFTIVLLTLGAPTGASEMNPLTTLVKNAITLGVSPIQAHAIVKEALSLTADDIGAAVDLQHYDAYNTLFNDPGDAVALAVEKKAVQVAVMASVGGDPIGMSLTQAMLLAHSTNTTLDLSDLNVIASVLGLDPAGAVVHEIWDRNANIAQANGLADIEFEWADMQSGLAVVLSDSVADLGIHINQAPTGFATAELLPGTQFSNYMLSADALLAGFSDPDAAPGTTLAIGSLASDVGFVAVNPDGSFSIILGDYTGPVELSYEVLDGQGGVTLAKQFFVVLAAADHEATGTLGISGTAAEGGALSADSSGLSDLDGGISSVAYQWQLNSGSGFADIAGATAATLAIPSDQSYVGMALRLTAVTIDAYGGTSNFSSAAQTVANVNDAPSGTVSIVGTVAAGALLTASNNLADPDGLGSIGYAWKADGAHLANGPSYLLTPAEAGKAITVEASYVDAWASFELVASTAVGFGFTLSGTRQADVLGGSAWNDSLSGLAGNDMLAGLVGDDWLDGGTGADTMSGGAGNDTYIVDNVKDRVVETTGTGDSGGVDTVSSEQNWTLGDFVENLNLTGTRGIDGYGNALGNAMRGNTGANVLHGGAGADRLAGDAGNDSLYGDTGSDLFVFDTALHAKKNVDRIFDFSHGDDTIVLARSVFTSFTAPGPIAAANFVIGAAATTASQYLVYDPQTGALLYDADGNGGGSAIEFATLIGVPTLAFTDFVIGG